MQERGVSVDHTTVFRWVQRYAPALDKRCRPHLTETHDSYRVDETYIKIKKQLRQCKYLNNVVEQDHRFIKRRINPGPGFGSFRTARRTLRGYEAMHMIRKDQLVGVAKGDLLAQNRGIAQMFRLVA
jgi:transposase-like protein